MEGKGEAGQDIGSSRRMDGAALTAGKQLGHASCISRKSIPLPSR